MSEIARRERDVFAPLEIAAHLPAGCLTMVGLDLRDVTMEFNEWQDLGRSLGHVHRWGAWALGDWLNFGVALFGDDAYNATEGTVSDRYELAHRVTGLAAETLHNYASICGQIPRRNRRVELSFSTHEPVAKLDHEHQGEWLQRAIDESWRREDLRAAIRTETGGEGADASGGNTSGSSRVTLYERRDEAARLVMRLAQPAAGGRFVPDSAWAQLVAAYGGE